MTIVNGGASLQYTPLAGFEGNDSFTYTISDGQATSQPATVSITVITPVTPFARRDTATTTEISAGGAATGVLIDVLDNDKVHPNANALLLSFSATSTNGGTITRNDNGTPADTSDDTLQYVPAFEFQGTDTFTYVMNDTDDTGD